MSESNIKRYTADELKALKSETDWDRVRAAGDHEGPQEFEVDWSRAEIVTPQPKRLVSLRIDPEIIEFFKSEGPGYQTRMNAVLRAYMEAKKSA